MLFERIESEGLAHHSYLIGDSGEAVVIDPRRDCTVYLERASTWGHRIVTILETHRNEDYVIGSLELAARTGAAIWHADGQRDYRYGQPVEDGHTWTVGRLKLQAIRSPGHTPGSMSYLLHDPEEVPWMVFTGDSLFAGDVGRTDFMGPERLGEMAGLLYDSLLHGILPLGDGIIVCPAHGAGSACGSAIADRTWTTIGLERKHNARLQVTDRSAFVAQAARRLEYPPYFRMMEKLNLEGPPVLGALPAPSPLSPREFAARAADAQVLDVRSEMGFGSAHVPGALSIWEEGVPRYGGWFLCYDKPILLVAETNDVSRTVRYLVRLGFDRQDGFLAGGMHAWLAAGFESHHVETVTVHDLCQRLDGDEDVWILDVRSDEELERESGIPGAHHRHITQLAEHLDEVPTDRSVYVFCGTGLRAMIGASLLRRAGWERVADVLGGLAGWNSVSCPLP